MPSRMAPRSRIEMRSRSSDCSTRWTVVAPDDAGDQVVGQLLLLGRQVLDQLLDLGVGQQVRHVLLENFRHVRGQHRGRVDDGVAAEGGFLAQAVVDPGGGEAERRLLHVLARQLHLGAARVHGHELADADLAGTGLHLLDAQAVALAGQAHVVEDADAGHDEAEVGGQGAAERLDLVGEPAALQVVDQRAAGRSPARS